MEITGGEALAQQLLLEGTRAVFGIPGAQLDPATDGLAQLSDHIAYYTPRHEQATTYLADGYARSTGHVGVAMVVPGPGLLNALAGLSTAWACSSPILLIAGQLPTHTIGRGLGMLHEIPDQTATLRSLTTWSGFAGSPEEIPGLVHEAFRRLHTGRPRPVGLEIPPDVLSARADIDLIEIDGVSPKHADALLTPDPYLLEQAAGALRRAQRPVICAGWGVQAADATIELQQLAELLNAPVVMSLNGRGSISDRHRLAVGPLEGLEVLASSDTVLAVGTRYVMLGGGLMETPAGATLIMLNADPADMQDPRHPDVSLHGDAKNGLRALAEVIGQHTAVAPRDEELAAIRRRCRARFQELSPQWEFTRTIRDAIPDDGVLVSELTQIGYFANVAYPVYQPRTFLTPGYQGTLGYGFPTGLGIKLANPDRVVVSITGDGGFGWNMQELATARKYDIGLITVVFADGQFTNVKRLQRAAFDGRVIGADLFNPDFVALAESFGVAGRSVSSPEELGSALRESVASNEPTLIEVPVPEMPSPWPLMPMRRA